MGSARASLFFIVGMIYERRHTRLIADFGGLSKVMPIFAVFFMIVTLSSIGLPGTNGFVGEFLILLGAFRAQCRSTGVGGHGRRAGRRLHAVDVSESDVWEDHPSENEKLKDLNAREITILVPMVIMIFPHGDLSQAFFQQDGRHRGEVFKGFQGKGGNESGPPCAESSRNEKIGFGGGVWSSK